MGVAILFLFVIFETAFFAFALGAGKMVLGTLGLWTVAVANLLAAIGVAGFLWYRHPLAARNLERAWEGEPQEDGGVAHVDVTDLKAEAERLRSQGIEVGVVFELHGEIRLLDVFDPDGNRVQLAQELSAS